MTTSGKTNEWVEEFLSEPNEISLKALQEKVFVYPWCEEIAEWWELARNSQWKTPVILPLKLPEQNTIWFAGALNSKIASQVGEEL